MGVHPFSASGNSFGIHEWKGSGPAKLHVHYSDDEAWVVLDGELTFRYVDRIETYSAGAVVFVPAGMARTYSASDDARYLVVLTPRLSALINALHENGEPDQFGEIFKQFDSEIVE